MAKISILAGTTSKTVKLFLQDSSSTSGTGLTGLTSATSGLTAYYIKEGQNATTQITLSGGTLGTWSSGGLILVDATNMPGVYELGLPNAALTSAKSVIVFLQGAANMAPYILEIELTAIDNQATNFGLSTTGFTISSVSGSVGSVTSGVTVTTNNDKTGYSLTQTFPTNFSSLAITAGGLASINAASALTESYAALHATPTLAQLLFEVRALLAENSITGTTMTTNKIDGTTAAHTYTLNSSTAPTALTTAS